MVLDLLCVNNIKETNNINIFYQLGPLDDFSSSFLDQLFSSGIAFEDLTGRNSPKYGKNFFLKVGPNRSLLIFYNPFYRTYKYTMTQINFLPPPGFEPGSLGTVSR